MDLDRTAPRPDERAVRPRPQDVDAPSRPREPDDEVVLDVVGDLDLATAGRLRERLGRAGRRASSHVVLDLSRVDFVDCHGLGVILAARAAMGARLRVRATSPSVDALVAATRTPLHDGAPGPAPPVAGDPTDDWTAASRLDLVRRARSAGTGPAQVRGALVSRLTRTPPSRRLQQLLGPRP
ncbi:STAS domain-containing protein [Pseudokineococcus lusitanus]|uniref:Anti-anti-sigma factor n=1 Tax=Pseudokineococcus lusitanus TaxID=763993 RepID=A0A3N1HTJ7_9ACTN|nr:STAS domain-containing protein [Pseudokineococcus lusitanus]ROP45848.1 anti-anti-sigma factor [Pseudokineococcus lusitanus]